MKASQPLRICSLIAIGLVLLTTDRVFAQRVGPGDPIVTTEIRSDSLVMFGRAVAIHDGFAVVNEDSLTSNDVVLYSMAGDDWIRVSELEGDPDATSNVPSDPAFSADMDGDRVIWGAPTYDYPTRANGGVAYVFRRDGATWSREGKLTPADFEDNGDFGLSVAIDGDAAIVGSPDFEEETSALDEGAAYIFRHNGTIWVEEARLLPDDREAGKKFGMSVGISGDYAIVGVLIDSEAGAAAGAAYVFEKDNDTWAQVAKLLPNDPVLAGTFGIAVDIDGDRAVVGAQVATGNATASGAAYVFERVAGVWTQVDKLFGSDGAGGDFFGNSVSLDGDCVAVGAYLAGGGVGAAYVFALEMRRNGGWKQQVKLTEGDDAYTSNQFGASVSLSGNTLAVGAPFTDADGDLSFAGAVTVYENACTGTVTSISPRGEGLGSVSLQPNYPNPFRDETAISFSVMEATHVSVKVFDMLGREVAHLHDQVATPGAHVLTFEARDLPDGVYLVALDANGTRRVRPVTLAR